MTEEEVKLYKFIALGLFELNPAFPTKAYNCLDTLGKLPWPQSTKAEIWAALLEKVSLLLYVSSLAQLPPVEVFLAQLPLVEVFLAQLPLDETSLAQLPQHLGVQPDARTSANGVGSAPLKRFL